MAVNILCQTHSLSIAHENGEETDEGSGWWALQDLNLGPMDYESTALTAELRAPLVNLAQCLYGADTLVRRFDVEFFVRDRPARR